MEKSNGQQLSVGGTGDDGRSSPRPNLVADLRADQIRWFYKLDETEKKWRTFDGSFYMQFLIKGTRRFYF